MKWSVVLAMVCGIASGAAGQPTSVVNSPHNLSAGGPGPARATMENQVCIFCHAPHNSSPVRPLWNRVLPVDAYSIYTSRALDAQPGQPTGSSKMCLSCHDGTIALGSVVSRGTMIQMSGGITTMPAGSANLGTDLSDDHPVSFRFDASLAARDPKLRSPSAMPHEIRLDKNSELQCTSCHDAHSNTLGKFLVMRNSDSELCISCHQVGTTAVAGHGRCADCHQPHSAPSGPYLLRRRTVADTCLTCHSGLMAGAANIGADMSKVFVHDTGSPVDPPDPARDHATCSDCHEPHTMGRGRANAPNVHASMGRIDGVNSSGSAIKAAMFEAEVCFKCHADGNTRQPTIPRRIVQNNTRLEFSPSAVSFHPVQSPGRNAQVPSLRPGWSTSSVMNCSDCHGSDSGGGAAGGFAAVGGSGPRGVHGSNFEPLLAARYETGDFTSESTSSYALCYQCHDRASILSDASFPGHRRHIVEERTPCAACHDAHGIASGQGNGINNSNLINFATNIVFPDRATGRLEFRDTGVFSGECFLSCHGVDHSPKRYPEMPALGAPARRVFPR